MRLIKRILFVILLIIGFGAISIGLGYSFIKVKYDVDLINVVNQIKKLSDPVNEKELCPEAYGFEDVIDRELVFKNMLQQIKLTDKQTAAIADMIIEEEYNTIELAGYEIPIKLKQVDFKNISNGGTDFNIVAKLDIRELKKEISSKFDFAMNKYIPEYIYLSSTFKVEKTNDAFEYVVKHISLTVNNIENDDVEEIIRLVNIFKEIGSLEEINISLGNKIMEILVGTKEEPGLALTMKTLGATDFKFIEEEGKQYFVITN